MAWSLDCDTGGQGVDEVAPAILKGGRYKAQFLQYLSLLFLMTESNSDDKLQRDSPGLSCPCRAFQASVSSVANHSPNTIGTYYCPYYHPDS